ncbi:polylysine protein precursor, putative [Trichomonas vaginalis G3]|uniref:Polylysine protein, putative n=1 Tax=Trichomonas vaginalis (strain ATCC PRA-98 / G3) TaxID=412133 RepID=A2G3U4_TRIV3|nr:hypothetical protein TVAGG3_0071970 [Trichomonas vaginalis G3]EAX88166.1 polylysine protein precursor, putative [Trichomonas vaginalis G3]KAI5542561.1 hypothetical protein TVAGG3_0071970 [Trichomonas vaginalis G3]|eukprot:XP_001301096.1 polylysine protein precursor [Trichomonas vaginalis G3]
MKKKNKERGREEEKKEKRKKRKKRERKRREKKKEEEKKRKKGGVHRMNFIAEHSEKAGAEGEGLFRMRGKNFLDILSRTQDT